MFDPELYRDKDEVEDWKHSDPLDAYKESLESAGLLTEAEWEAMETEVVADVQRAVDFAEAGTLESIDDLTRFVHTEEVVV